MGRYSAYFPIVTRQRSDPRHAAQLNQNDTITIKRICFSSLGTGSAPTVYFVPAADSIQRHDFSSGKVSTVVKTGKRLDFGLAVTRDGSAIYYTQMDHERSELLLVENFR